MSNKCMMRVIADRSGSMAGKEADVIGGINTFIADQKKIRDDSTLAIVRFDTEYECFRPSLPLQEVRPLTPDEYAPRGGTALLDAIGRSLAEMDAEWIKTFPDRAIVVIATDGEENSSHEFTLDRIKAMIKTREASGKWAFIFLGAGVDAFSQATAMGIQSINTAGYVPTGVGTQTAYTTASASVSNMRSTGSTVANLGTVLPEQTPKSDDDTKAWRAP
jgi:uncharacterized protein YegL